MNKQTAESGQVDLMVRNWALSSCPLCDKKQPFLAKHDNQYMIKCPKGCFAVYELKLKNVFNRWNRLMKILT